MRAALRHALRVLLAAATALLVAGAVAAALLVAFARGWQRPRVEAFVEARLAAALGAEVEIGRLEGGLFDGFVAHDVVARAGAGPPLVAERLAASYALGPLLRARRVAIERIEIAGLRGVVRRGADGWHVSGLARPLGVPDEEAAQPERAPWLRGVEVGELVVRDAGVAVLAPAPVPAAGAEAAETAAGDTQLALGLAARVRGLRWRAGEPVPLPAALAASLALAPSRVAGREVESASLEASLAGRTLRIAGADLAAPFGRLAVSQAEVGFAGDALPPRVARASAEAEVAGLDLGVLLGEPRLASALAGPLTLRFEPAEGGATGRVVLDAALRSPRLGALDIETVALEGWIDTGTRAFAAERVRLAGALGEIEASGAGDPEALARLALDADVDLARLPPAWLGGAPVAGRLRAALAAHGPWADPRGTLDATVEGLAPGALGPGRLALRGEAPGGRRLHIEPLELVLPDLAVRASEPVRLRLAAQEPPVLEIEALALAAPGARLAAEGRISGRALGDLRLAADVSELGTLLAALGVEAPVAGRLAANLVADGPLARPALRGDVLATRLTVGETGVERIALEIAPGGDALALAGRVVDAGAERVRLTGSLPREALLAGADALLGRDDTRLALTAEALDLAWLAGLAGQPRDRLRGRLDARVELRGGVPRPTASGRARVVDAWAAVPDLAEPVGPIEAALALDGQTIAVERLHVAGRPGAIRAAGTLTWSFGAAAAPVATNLGLVVDGFTLPPGGLVAGRLDGALALNGTWPELFLGGRVELAQARVRLPEVADPTWSEIRIHGLPGEEGAAEQARRADADGAPPPVVRTSAANVVFAVAPSTWVEGHGADLRITGEVRVLKAPGEEPLYVGSIRSLEGVFQFRNRRFEIERAVATLAGTRQLDPELDLVATQRIRDVTLRVVVSGRASAPDVALESDPPLDPTDQLSYLAFGRPASALGTSDAARLESAATSVVTQLLAGSGATGGLFEALPLDRFQFEAGTGESGRGVSVGTRVAPGVTLTYERDFATHDEGARLEWRFHPNWRIQSEIEESGETGADVFWNFEF